MKNIINATTSTMCDYTTNFEDFKQIMQLYELDCMRHDSYII